VNRDDARRDARRQRHRDARLDGAGTRDTRGHRPLRRVHEDGSDGAHLEHIDARSRGEDDERGRREETMRFVLILVMRRRRADLGTGHIDTRTDRDAVPHALGHHAESRTGRTDRGGDVGCACQPDRTSNRPMRIRPRSLRQTRLSLRRAAAGRLLELAHAEQGKLDDRQFATAAPMSRGVVPASAGGSGSSSVSSATSASRI
jgi:hypothetical protein